MADGSEEPAGAGPNRPAQHSAEGVFAPFGFRNFRAVWIANVLSQVGSQLQAVGAGWLMTELTGEHKLVAAVQSATALSMLFLSVLSGAVADNFDRRRIMLAAQCYMLTVSAVLSALTWAGWIGPWSLLALTLAVGAGMTMQMPAWQASVRALVDPRVLPQAISWNSIAFNLARTVGPALGGLVLALAGVSPAFALNALSYVALIFVLRRWRPELDPPARQPLLPSIRAGVIYSVSAQPLRRLMIRGAGYTTGAIAVQALLPVIVRDVLHGEAADFGLLLGAFGVGAVAGALFAQPIRRRWGSEAALAIASCSAATALAGLALVGSVTAGLPFTLLAGVGWTACMTTMNVGTQLRSPEDMLGRTMSIYLAVTFGAASVAAWAWGTLADLTDIRTALGAAAVYTLVVAAALRFLASLPARGEGVLLARH